MILRWSGEERLDWQVAIMRVHATSHLLCFVETVFIRSHVSSRFFNFIRMRDIGLASQLLKPCCLLPRPDQYVPDQWQTSGVRPVSGLVDTGQIKLSYVLTKARPALIMTIEKKTWILENWGPVSVSVYESLSRDQYRVMSKENGIIDRTQKVKFPLRDNYDGPISRKVSAMQTSNWIDCVD